MVYKNFEIEHFKGIEKISISLVKHDLVLLLGLNESGKTTILRAIEAFDFRNDRSQDYKDDYFKLFRNKSDVGSNNESVITATIELQKDLKFSDYENLINKDGNFDSTKAKVEELFKQINNQKTIKISRVFPFKNGNPQPNFYRIEHGANELTSEDRLKRIAREIVQRCPFIIYFEDFKDRIPEKIFTSESSDSYNADWYDIIDGLFYNTNDEFSIKEYKKFFAKANPRISDANTVLKRVNKTLNKSFSDKWKKLSGVKDIEETEIKFNPSKQYFELEITDVDGTTFTVDERSKGALWYLSFLMKTEFRRKKMRKNSGRPIYLIDEPASNLHSTAQQNMIQDFQKLVEDTSVIYTTHSQYLISLHNIKNTYVVEKDKKNRVKTTLWSEYIKDGKAKPSYYQPLANVLNIIPNTLDIPWNKAILTEGPSDMFVLEVMYDALYNKKRDYVVYPGTSATSLDSLISLNLGWGAKFKILLDSDEAGRAARTKYMKSFDLAEDVVLTLPINNKKIETYFTLEDRKKIYALAFDKEAESVNKKAFSSAFSLLKENSDKTKKLKKLLDKETIENFKELFDKLTL